MTVYRVQKDRNLDDLKYKGSTVIDSVFYKYQKYLQLDCYVCRLLIDREAIYIKHVTSAHMKQQRLIKPSK